MGKKGAGARRPSGRRALEIRPGFWTMIPMSTRVPQTASGPRESTLRIRRATVALALLAPLALGVGVPARAQTKYPNVNRIHPLAVTRGRTTEVELQFDGTVRTASLALVEGSGIRAEVVERSEERKISDNRAIVRLEVADDAAIGPRDIRLVTGEAITTLARVYVTDLDGALEQGKHGTREQAQPIELPSVVSGCVEGAVEIDWYRFEGKKGERVNFEVLGTRLHETIQKIGRFTPHFDALISLTDAEGRELAMNDDHYYADPLLSYVLPADGAYHVAVREANYKGHATYTYALVATRGPLPTLTFPLAAPVGASAEVEFVGPGVEPGTGATLALPDDAVPGRVTPCRPRLADGSTGRAVDVLPTTLPVVFEKASDAPQPISMPAGIAGRIEREDDDDAFVLDATKGARYRFEVFARRLFSPLDAVITVEREDGRVLASGDDSRDAVGRISRDPALEWTAPADGRHVLRIRDLHRRGGSDFVYHLECAVAEPDFELTFDPELAMVGPGNRTPIYVRAHRRGYDGEIALRVDGLPEGVDAIVPPIRAGMRDACVVLSVAPDAPPGGSNFTVSGTATVPRSEGEATIVRDARPLVEIYQAQRVIGRTAAVAVTRPSDIEVTTTVHEVVLAPGETKVIPIKIVRGESYRSGSVSLWGMWRFNNTIFGSSLPPGVVVDASKSRTGIIGDKVDGALALRAEKNAKPIAGVQTVVIGLVPIEFSVFVPYCTGPILVTVTDGKDAVATAK